MIKSLMKKFTEYISKGENEMFIRKAHYSFYSGMTIVRQPVEVTKETDKCYFAGNSRYLKSEIGIPMLKSVSQYPFVEVVMLDATEEMILNKLSEWFFQRATMITGKE